MDRITNNAIANGYINPVTQNQISDEARARKRQAGQQKKVEGKESSSTL